MRMKMMWIRTLTAAALFAVLAGVNTWVGTTEHLVLAVGYRAFLVAAPAFLFLGLAGGMKAALFLSFLASAASLFFLNGFTLGVFALGMAVSGYLAKYVAAHTSQGAADNKVSLNLGSLLSGRLLLCAFDQKVLLVILTLLLLASLILALRVD